MIAMFPKPIRLVGYFILWIGIPGFLSFAILRYDVQALSKQVDAHEVMVKELVREGEISKKELNTKLESIERSLGRVEGKLDGRR